MNSSKQSIILIERNVILRRVYAKLLRKFGFKVRVFSTLPKASGFPDWMLISQSECTIESIDNDKFKALKDHGVQFAMLKETDEINIAEELKKLFSLILPVPFRESDLERLITWQSKQDSDIFDYTEFETAYVDSSLKTEIIQMFLNDENTSEKALIDAFASNDVNEIHAKVHYMKGSLVYLKAKRLLNITQQAVNSCRENEVEKVLRMKDEILEERNKLVKVLQDYLANR
jgi:HPt (histidine-containing phosphotransfer) domain-containing protein